jgi:2-dehydro-3-deoxyphosphogluconate aldolase / (4S)-4-hydroxy-2-oxoglutarate aldolase
MAVGWHAESVVIIDAQPSRTVLYVKKEEVKQRILDIGIVPVIRASSPHEALLAAEAVCAGGVSIAEITMTVPGAFETISELARQHGRELVVGAGTVLDAATARRCLDAGAEFLVSPGFDADLVKFANTENVLVMAGALTPTEVIRAWAAGADFVKVFPCNALGGASYIKALRSPLPQIPLVPTGGVTLETARGFIRAGAAALGIGGALVSPATLDCDGLARIVDLAGRFLEIVREARAEHAAGVTPPGNHRGKGD